MHKYLYSTTTWWELIFIHKYIIFFPLKKIEKRRKIQNANRKEGIYGIQIQLRNMNCSATKRCLQRTVHRREPHNHSILCHPINSLLTIASAWGRYLPVSISPANSCMMRFRKPTKKEAWRNKNETQFHNALCSMLYAILHVQFTFELSSYIKRYCFCGTINLKHLFCPLYSQWRCHNEKINCQQDKKKCIMSACPPACLPACERIPFNFLFRNFFFFVGIKWRCIFFSQNC